MKKHVKREARIIGFDDAPFKRQEKKVLVVGAVYRGGNYIDGLLSFLVKNDGRDVTDKMISAIRKTRHKDQLSYIMLNGISYAGFNIVDIWKLWKKTKLPVIVVMRKMPNVRKFKKALSRINKRDVRLVDKAGKIQRIRVKLGNLYIQTAGIELRKARELLHVTCVNSLVPEPLRVSHLIASGIKEGESRGRA